MVLYIQQILITKCFICKVFLSYGALYAKWAGLTEYRSPSHRSMSKKSERCPLRAVPLPLATPITCSLPIGARVTVTVRVA